MKKLLAGLASLVGVAACGQDAPYGHVEMFSARESTQSYFFSATSRGPLLVDVRGSYPGFEADAVSGVITAGMERGMQSRPFKTTMDISEAESPSYRVFWLIAPPKNFNTNRLCKGEIPESVPSEKPTFSAVFCVGDDVYRDISGWVHKDVTADSEAFTKFVGVVTRALFK
ncbi:conserved exported hypothetical protein [Candidatus Terasakiella magnetica]|uniref:Lipoprotein n=1 Tax=Candidatus Terasakiella magnetica TaxID=1867952 RepID=A0A1C3RLL7_9PROT|nr:hypothetical protein [Candidatus Terasakiella magnetica]SCA58175.1 conserved exported hypothetical protein [Candidatus Terasakiella magnetica]